MRAYRKVVHAVVVMSVMAATSFGIGSTAVAAGQNSCLAGDACFSNYTSGSIVYGYVSNDMNTCGEFFDTNPDVSVCHNVGYGRNRDSFYKFLCVYTNINYDTLQNVVNYDGVTWVLIGPSSASEQSHTTSTLC